MSEFVTGGDRRNELPLTPDIFALHLLTLEIAARFPAELEEEMLRMYLKMYVAIRHEAIKLDPTEDQLIRNQANRWELIEGTAKYYDAMAGKQIIANFPPSFSTSLHKTEFVQDNSALSGVIKPKPGMIPGPQSLSY